MSFLLEACFAFFRLLFRLLPLKNFPIVTNGNQFDKKTLPFVMLLYQIRPFLLLLYFSLLQQLTCWLFNIFLLC
jgi:hypothetical protein